MTDPRHRIVVALDLAEYSEIVLEHAIDEAAHHRGLDLHVIHVVEPSRRDLDDIKKQLGDLVLPMLDTVDSADWRLHLHVRAGSPPQEIAALAADVRAHLLVIGRFGVHHPHRRIGLEASRIVDVAPCPTLVVGLTDQTSDTRPQCPDCVSAREHSDGRRWFCHAHAAPERERLSATITRGASWTGGLMW